MCWNTSTALDTAADLARHAQPTHLPMICRLSTRVTRIPAQEQCVRETIQWGAGTLTSLHHAFTIRRMLAQLCALKPY